MYVSIGLVFLQPNRSAAGVSALFQEAESTEGRVSMDGFFGGSIAGVILHSCGSRRKDAGLAS